MNIRSTLNIPSIEFDEGDIEAYVKSLRAIPIAELEGLKKNISSLEKLIDQLLVAVTKEDQSAISPKGKDRFMAKIYRFLEANYADPNFGVEELSEAVLLSRSQLFRKLKILINDSPSRLIRRYRLDKACTLLESSDGKPSEIAYQVGFKTPSYFSKCFKDEFKITPSEFMT